MNSRELMVALKETPIERIIRKVLGRRLTEAERLTFHLKPANKQSARKSTPPPPRPS